MNAFFKNHSKMSGAASLKISNVFNYVCTLGVSPSLVSRLGCANKDLDGYLGPLGKFIEYCRITALLLVIPLGIRDNW